MYPWAEPVNAYGFVNAVICPAEDKTMNAPHDHNRELAVLTSAVENTNEAFVTIEENHKILFFNKAAERIFGYNEKRGEIYETD